MKAAREEGFDLAQARQAWKQNPYAQPELDQGQTFR